MPKNVSQDPLTTVAGVLLAGLVAVQAVPDIQFPDWAQITLAFSIAALGALTRR